MMIKANLHKLTELSFREKSQINNLIQKEELSKDDIQKILLILSKLKNKDLVALFGSIFEDYANNFVQWGNGWYEDLGVNRLILNNFLNTKIIGKEQKLEFLLYDLANKIKEISASKEEDFLIKHKKFLDFLKLAYEGKLDDIEGFWVIENYEKPTKQDELIITKILDRFSKYNKINSSSLFFYRTTIKAAPLIFDKKNYMSRREIGRILNTTSNLVVRKATVYLNPIKYPKRKEDYSISKSTRNLICRLIYALLINNTKKQEIVSSINNSILSKKETSKEFKKYFERYVHELIEIVDTLYDFNKNSNKIKSISIIATDLRKKGLGADISSGYFRIIISEINDDLSETFSDYNLNRTILFSQDEFLNLDRKEIRKLYPNTTTDDIKKIMAYIKQIKLIRYLIKKYLTDDDESIEKACFECGLSVEDLYCLEFHHLDSENKKDEWDKIQDLPYEILKKKLLNDKVVPLCRNCHSGKKAKNYIEFKDLIHNKDLFKLSSEQIEALFKKEVNIRKNSLNKNQKLKFWEYLMAWLKKRALIEQIFDGKCVGCGKEYAMENIALFDFHHRSKKKTNSWEKIKWKDLEDIIKWIKKDNCVALCTNCHSLIHSKVFIKYSDIILKKKGLKAKIIKKLSKINKNIANFDFTDKIVVNPLRKTYIQKEAWKKYLEYIYQIMLDTNKDEIKTIDLAKSLGMRTCGRKVLEKLEKKKYIKLIIETNGRYTGAILNKTGAERAIKQLENRCIYRILKLSITQRSKVTIKKLKPPEDEILSKNVEKILDNLETQKSIQINDHNNIKLTEEGIKRYKRNFMS